MDTRVIATFKYRHEAEVARSFLEMEGIESVIATDDAGGAYPGALLPARIIVREDDADRALEILARSET
jgi:hypothetical protein